MAGGRFSVLFRRFFQVGINIRPTKHGGGWDGRGVGGRWGGWVGWEGGGRVVGRGVGREEAKPP